MKKRKLSCYAALAALLLLLPLFAACGGGGEPEPESTAEVTSAPSPSGEGILWSDLASYTIIRPDACGDVVKSATTQLLSAMSDKTGVNIRPKTDYFREGVPVFAIEDREILIGRTNRPESKRFLSGLRANDFGYALDGTKIVIGGATEEGTKLAVAAFISGVVDPAQAGGTFMTEAQNTVLYRSYDIENLTLGGIPVNEFRIVYPAASASARCAAEEFSDAVSAASGWVLETVSDKTAHETGVREIRIGMTNRDTAVPSGVAEDEVYLGFDGTDLRILGHDTGAVLTGVRDLTASFAGKKGESLDIPAPAERKVKYDSSVLTAMSFNVLVSQRSAERDARVIRMVNTYLPDTVGFQEASPDWMNVLKKQLSDTYAWVGEGRDGGGSGEYNPIFYNKSKFKLLDSGTRWLSDTPEKVSKYEQSSLNRIWTYALLERRTDGAVVMVVNTHFDHVSEEARDLQAKALGVFLGKCFDRNYTVVLTGDFNTTADKPCYASVLSAGISNSFDVRESGTAANTFTNYGAASRIIDFIFVTPGTIAVRNYKVCNEKIDGDWPSDHHPVLIEYMLVK